MRGRLDTMKIEWQDIDAGARKIFNIWGSGGDYHFGREAWAHLTTQGLTDDTGLVSRMLALARLIVVRQICEEFARVKWDENAEMELCDYADDLEIDPFALGFTIAKLSATEAFDVDETGDARSAALLAVCAAVRPEVVRCLKDAYGGTKGFYDRLCRTASDDDENDSDDGDFNGHNLAVYSHVENLG